MIFDTDVLIWIQRGNRKAARLVGESVARAISAMTAMELLQGAQKKEQHRTIKTFLREMDFEVLPLTENIGHRALVYVEEYALSSGLVAADAIIAATATENARPLCTANRKHFQPIRDLELRVFRP